ncbi:putative leucine-rich repeat-containing protein DDB_G0290503 [Sabethes cyaneus]|uniref:putative leucine-rich repeat-containing protein DDB_G0290503 n=1 Tax=Sabethes cyaneus TaxID=53552 RepID=UPI00237EBAF7|nr:putative leucine-rich repeat-containing protein DDB_G0290503 [Sabethes cyaneus]
MQAATLAEMSSDQHQQRDQSANTGTTGRASSSVAPQTAQFSAKPSDSDSEKVTLYLSAQKASEYHSKMANRAQSEGSSTVVSIRKSPNLIKCDSDKEVNSLKRKKMPLLSHHSDNNQSRVLKQSDAENIPPPAATVISVAGFSGSKRIKIDPQVDGKIVASKPPIPPKADAGARLTQQQSGGGKSKKQAVCDTQNALTVQKLLAQNEQMRLEINELRVSLATERGAVRVLRAQNETDLRRSKNECKKLQEALTHQKRSSAASASANKRANRSTSSGGSSEDQHSNNNGGQTALVNQLNLDILKLNQELSAMRESNKFLEDKIQISSEAGRRKASDMRVQRDLYELRLTQLTKSAKSEIQRLLEELKSKDRSTALLRKELLALQKAGGTKKEKKAAKNSAQQSQEMRQLHESEPCSGNVSKSSSHNSIQSVCEELERKNDAEADPVAPSHQSRCSPSSESSPAATADSGSGLGSGGPQQTTNDHYESDSSSSLRLALGTTTCGDDRNGSMPHESRTMEAHNDVHASVRLIPRKEEPFAITTEPTVNSELNVIERTTMSTTVRQLSTVSDADSAISSAPPSLSPQATGCPNSPEVWRAHSHPNQQQAAHLQSLRDQSQLIEIKMELDRMQAKYDLLSADYGRAKTQIDELERELMETTQASRERAKFAERVEYLEQREESLLRESHELREQNELLEFRIIELEESHDKWSLRSNSSPTTVGSSTGSTNIGTGHTGGKDHVWTDTDKEQDDLIMHSERSDSGVTSPNSHHHLDDHRMSGVPSPCCDLSLLDQIPTDDVRKRIITMSKRACYDEEDKTCLLQILSLLNNLEALSQDHEIGSEEMSLEVPVKYNYPFTDSQPPKSLAISSTPFKSQQGKIVATVQPFNNTMSSSCGSSNEPKSLSIASIAETFGGMKKSGRWGSASLQESGVFVDEMMVSNVSTQTVLEDFPCLERTNAELCAEIEKLNKFRKKIEECSIKRRGKNPVGVSLSLPAESCEKRRLQYYVERLEQLENKIKVYESSGDQQLRHLAERLQREIQLESWVNLLSEQVGKLEEDNERLEEERCELEEIENDTRLKLQRMEMDYEVMTQRNTELEMSKSSYQSKYQDARDSVVSLEELVNKCEERIFILEETENELNDRIDLILAFIPVLLMFNSWQLQETMAATRKQYALNYIPPEHIEYYETANDNLQMRLNELMTREKELTQNIAELNRAYNETLENADNLWAQMEKEYKDKISKCETVESNLKSKIAQLEERLSKDSEYAHERITHLEEAENTLKSRVAKLNKDNKELIAKHAALLEEYSTLKEEYRKLQDYLRGPALENLEKEKRKIVALEEELVLSTRLLKEVEETHKSEVGQMRGQMMSAAKELTHIEVTNSELREEVETLENRIRELLTLRNADDERIKHLTEELQAKQAHISQMQLQQQQQQTTNSAKTGYARSLAQELERPVKGSYSKLGYEIHPLSRRFPGDSDSSGSEDKIKFPVSRPVSEPKEVKSLAETIILNAESRGIRTPKKSFVEEARSRFARWV